MQATRNRATKAKAAPASDSAAVVLAEAAKRNGVPLWALTGVKLSETGSAFTGAGVSNPFELEPGAAAQVGVKDVGNFEEAANGAARLLASYKKQFGSWNSAFEAYNGGPGAVGKGYAYDQAHVEGKLSEFHLPELLQEAHGATGGRADSFSIGGIDPLEGLEEFGQLFGGKGPGNLTGPGSGPNDNPLGEAGQGAIGAISSLAGFLELLTSGELWLRIGEILAGGVLLILGLKSLTGAELPSVVPVPV